MSRQTPKTSTTFDKTANKNITVNNTPQSVFNQKEAGNLDILIEQYKIYVDSANQTSSLRAQANTFYLTINTALIGFLSATLAFLGESFSSYWILLSSTAGLLVCISWVFSLRSYRSLNSGRFTVIQEIEKRLPARMYAREWELITAKRYRKSKYLRQTSVEQFVPIAFGALYTALAIAITFL